MTDCGLYIHTPFCETKCGYCDFFSVALKDRPTAPLVAALIEELRARTADSVNSIRTVFVGGGTPTVLPPRDLAVLMRAIADTIGRHPIEEFTVEANPATIDAEKLDLLTSAGVDRISMGAQSWHSDELATLERLHTPDDIAPGVALARKAGIKRLNLDLIFGIPGQTAATWAGSLARTIDLGVDHISCYGLTFEPNTRLTAQRDAGTFTPMDEDLESDMYFQALDTLAAAGYEQYEISNFARPDQRCAHNMIYWRNAPYIGVGPSAAGYVDGVRYKNISDVNGYIRRIRDEGSAVVDSERIGGATLAGETIMLQLRLNDGVDLPAIRNRCGIDPLSAMAGSIGRHRHLGLVTLKDGILTLTRNGRLVADAVIADMFAEIVGHAPPTQTIAGG